MQVEREYLGERREGEMSARGLFTVLLGVGTSLQIRSYLRALTRLLLGRLQKERTTTPKAGAIPVNAARICDVIAI